MRITENGMATNACHSSPLDWDDNCQILLNRHSMFAPIPLNEYGKIILIPK